MGPNYDIAKVVGLGLSVFGYKRTRLILNLG
jgi:hypothetical protein